MDGLIMYTIHGSRKKKKRGGGVEVVWPDGWATVSVDIPAGQWADHWRPDKGHWRQAGLRLIR